MKSIPASPRFSRRYWANLARFMGLCLAAGALALIVYMGRLGMLLADEGIYPPRQPVEGSPRSAGIEDYEDVSLVTADGLTLRGWYIPSQNGAAVILGHGQGGNRTMLLPEAAILARQGYGVLLFDWRAHGESEGDFATVGDRERQDLEAAIDFVAARPDVDPERIGALGFSMGAVVVTEVAASDPRLKGVIVEAPFPTLAEEVQFRTRSLPFLGPVATWWGQLRTGSSVAYVRPLDDICGISPRPVLLIYGAQDEMVPPNSADQMFAAACDPKQLWLIEGVGHGGYHDALPEEYERRIVGFFDEALR